MLDASVTCNAEDLTITPTSTNTSHVSKEEAVDEFKMRGYNCTSKSLEATSRPAWEIRGFSLNRTYVPGDPNGTEPGGYMDDVEFYYNNTATDNDWPRNTGWRQCLFMSETIGQVVDDPKGVGVMISFEPFRLGFGFNNKTSTITLSQGWSCDGREGKHT